MTTTPLDSYRRYPVDQQQAEPDLGTQPHHIYTIGHGAADFPPVARVLAAHDVSMIVDVRSAPYSRHSPDFEKRELTHRAAEFNFGYRWLGDRLGGRPNDPRLQRNGRPDWDAITAGDGFAAGVTELEGLAAAGTVVLLCAESDPAHCHRSLILAPELEQRGHCVMHILSDGTAIRHQPTLGFEPLG